MASSTSPCPCALPWHLLATLPCPCALLCFLMLCSLVLYYSLLPLLFRHTAHPAVATTTAIVLLCDLSSCAYLCCAVPCCVRHTAHPAVATQTARWGSTAMPSRHGAGPTCPPQPPPYCSCYCQPWRGSTDWTNDGLTHARTHPSPPHTHTLTIAHAHSHTCARTRTYTHTRTHSHTHVHTHTHTPTRSTQHTHV